ncbi:MAG: hypothetical protein ABI679_13425 [Gemmatimonadota bacterium]
MPRNPLQPQQIRRALVVGILLMGTQAGVARGQQPCPRQAGTEVMAGWKAYRADSLAIAEAHFAAADGLCAHNLDAKTGLGFTALRRNSIARADSIFHAVIAEDERTADAWSGLALTANRKGDSPAAILAARRVIALAPGDSTARSLLDRLDPGWNRKAREPNTRPVRTQLVSRTRGSSFQVHSSAGWSPFYIKGINLGAALPGKYPSEFPTDSALYDRWLRLMAGMNANTVRLYTILPPEFYRALRGWNLAHPASRIWLVHGVWTELPPEHDFDDAGWKSGFREEMARVVDLVHGAADIRPQPGHASGRYDADVSPWTLAYIIGREWEPFAVKAFDEKHPGSGSYRGRYLATVNAPALDRWMAEQCDYLLSREMDRFNAIRPIAYTNWPTLDPLAHPTESTTDEEASWRRKLGQPANLTREYDNDATGLDPNLVHPTAANPAGWFASYHAYPYYPDFLLNDPGYNRARSSEGRSNYFGYLASLKRHHARIPLVIAEYGVPSSRGTAHLQPQGFDHGGHDEREMARIDARLTREIRESGAAGGILFAWLDEWFKKNWVVIDFEIPLDNTRLWHNVMDAEQNYGILGQYAGRAEETPRLGGDPSRWKAPGPIYRASSPQNRQPGSLAISHDASYIYLAVTLTGNAGRPFSWDSAGLMIAIDTYLPDEGQHSLPRSLVTSDLGFEFLIDLRGPRDGEIRVLPEYNPYGGPPDSTRDDAGMFYHRPITITDHHDGAFDSMYVGTNRARFGRDGQFFPASGMNRGRLRFGTDSASTLSDWYYDEQAQLLEVRLPWALLNVSDPSTGTLLYEKTRSDVIGTAAARDFHFGVLTYLKGPEPRALGALPALINGRWSASSFLPWTWSHWDTPEFHERLKPVYNAMKKTWADTVAPRTGQ